MHTFALQSGSTGNCIYVDANGTRLLFDAGISGKQAEQRLAAAGRDIRDVDALIVSHDHADHCRSVGIYHRKFGLPVHITRPTYKAASRRCSLGHIGEIRRFKAGKTIRFGSVSVETIPTPHDGADGVAFVVDDGRRRLGILTDLGHVFDGLDSVICSLDALYIESNYDPEMLISGSYPDVLIDRIQGPGGHISNSESARLLAATDANRLQWACLAHLSEENNAPAVALQTHQKILGEGRLLHVADRRRATPELEV